MTSGSLTAGQQDSPHPGITRRSFDSERATVARYTFEPGARFPMHRHPEEQITLVEEGTVEFTVAGETAALGPGEWAVAPPEVEHGLVAGPDGARFLAIIVPRRASASAYEVLE